MRLPLTQIYRAFPELDRFTDDQCRRFVRAACRRGWRRHAHRAMIACTYVSVGFILTFIGRYALDPLGSRLFGPHYLTSWGYDALLGVCLALALLLPAIVAFVARDALLRRRIRYVIRARGTCPGCRYSLLGIVVSDRNTVVCPECGMGVEADPSLNELTTDDQGRARFTPSATIDGKRFWTPRRLRLLKRSGIALGVILFVLLPSGWGLYELFLMRQAAAARADRPGIEAVMAYVEANQPPDAASDGPNAWDLFDRAQGIRATIEAEIGDLPSFRDAGGYRAYPEYSFIYTPIEEDRDEERMQDDRRAKAMAEALLSAFRERGFYEAFGAVTPCRRAVQELDVAPDDPLAVALAPNLSDVRACARINAARMHLAYEEGDLSGFIAAFESNLALARICRHQVSLISVLVATAVESLTLSRLRVYLLQDPPEEWLDAVEAAIERQRDTLPRDYAIRAEEMISLDLTAWLFAEPSRVRFGRRSKAIETYTGGVIGLGEERLGRLGSYRANRDVMRRFFDAAAAIAVQEPFERAAGPFADLRGLLIPQFITPAIERSIETLDRLHAERRGAAVMLALERYYLDHHAYPRALNELIPEHLDALPTDPWTGEPLTYLALNEARLRYLLLATGPDGLADSIAPGSDPWQPNYRSDVVFSPPR